MICDCWPLAFRQTSRQDGVRELCLRELFWKISVFDMEERAGATLMEYSEKLIKYWDLFERQNLVN